MAMDPMSRELSNMGPSNDETMKKMEQGRPELLAAKLIDEKNNMLRVAHDKFEDQQRADAIEDDDILSASVNMIDLPIGDYDAI